MGLGDGVGGATIGLGVAVGDGVSVTEGLGDGVNVVVGVAEGGGVAVGCDVAVAVAVSVCVGVRVDGADGMTNVVVNIQRLAMVTSVRAMINSRASTIRFGELW